MGSSSPVTPFPQRLSQQEMSFSISPGAEHRSWGGHSKPVPTSSERRGKRPLLSRVVHPSLPRQGWTESPKESQSPEPNLCCPELRRAQHTLKPKSTRFIRGFYTQNRMLEAKGPEMSAAPRHKPRIVSALQDSRQRKTISNNPNLQGNLLENVTGKKKNQKKKE